MHSSAEGHRLFPCPGYYSVAMNTGGHVSFQMIVLFSYMPRGGIWGSYVDSSFLRNLHSVYF